MNALEPELRAFVEEATGGRVTSFERSAVGSSRATFFVDVAASDGSLRQLVVRHDSGDGPMSRTDIDLAHEAVVYRALAPCRVRIPALVAVRDDGRSLLVEHVAGSEAFATLEPELRRSVADDFAAALAELHLVDPSTLELPGFARPGSAADHARVELRRWRSIQQQRVAEPDAAEITGLAAAWLDASAPDRVERSALCHGDAGVGNFLHDGGRVTALLDWEFAHVGDPLDDVAWVLVRSHLLGGVPEMRAALEHWSRLAKLDLDPPRIAYYRALVLLRMAISCRVALGHAAGGAMDPTTYQLLLPYLCFLLPQALREAGCRDAALADFERSGTEAIEAIPVLQAAARPLEPWQAS